MEMEDVAMCVVFSRRNDCSAQSSTSDTNRNTKITARAFTAKHIYATLVSFDGFAKGGERDWVQKSTRKYIYQSLPPSHARWRNGNVVVCLMCRTIKAIFQRDPVCACIVHGRPVFDWGGENTQIFVLSQQIVVRTRQRKYIYSILTRLAR